MSGFASVEFSHVYGQDFEIDPLTNDIMLAIDDVNSATATQQRIIRLVQTAPLLRDASGKPIAPPDDIFNPNFGAGLPSLVDELVTPSLINAIVSRIQAGLASDPGIVGTPSVVVTNDDGDLSVVITAQTATGQSVTTPSILLNRLGG